jgi:hypothetical protein
MLAGPLIADSLNVHKGMGKLLSNIVCAHALCSNVVRLFPISSHYSHSVSICWKGKLILMQRLDQAFRGPLRNKRFLHTNYVLAYSYAGAVFRL